MPQPIKHTPSSGPHTKIDNGERNTQQDDSDAKREADKNSDQRHILFAATSLGFCKTSAAGKFAPVSERHCPSRDGSYQKQERDHEVKHLYSWFEMRSAVLLLSETCLPSDQEVDNSQGNPGSGGTREAKPEPGWRYVLSFLSLIVHTVSRS